MLFTWFFTSTFFRHYEKHSIADNNYFIYYNEKINQENLFNLINDVNKTLDESGFLRNKEYKFKIFICNSKFLYSFLVPLNRNGYGGANKYTDDIIVANIDLERGLSHNYADTIPLKNSILLSHEITHVILKENKINLRQNWIEEGYCEYVGYGSKIDIKEMLKKSSQSKYVRYVLGVDYLLKKNGNNIKKLENIDLTNEEVLEMLKKETSQ